MLHHRGGGEGTEMAGMDGLRWTELGELCRALVADWWHYVALQY